MDRRFPCRFATAALFAFALAISGPAVAVEPAPVLQLSGNDFPELVVLSEELDAAGEPVSLSCDRIRNRRIDELDPLWKRAVERIHLDCQDLTEQDDGFEMAATIVTGFLKPGRVEFAGVPVAEVRMMDSELWGDHQYLLDRPFVQIRDTIRGFIESRCRAQQETRGALLAIDCTLVETSEGLYLQADEISGIWLHAAPDDPQRTVYAEAWSD